LSVCHADITKGSIERCHISYSWYCSFCYAKPNVSGWYVIWQIMFVLCL